MLAAKNNVRNHELRILHQSINPLIHARNDSDDGFICRWPFAPDGLGQGDHRVRRPTALGQATQLAPRTPAASALDFRANQARLVPARNRGGYRCPSITRTAERTSCGTEHTEYVASAGVGG